MARSAPRKPAARNRRTPRTVASRSSISSRLPGPRADPPGERMKLRSWTSIGAAALASLALGCAVAPEEDPVQIRLKDLDGRVQRIERVLTNQSLMELAQRIDTLQAD